MMTLSKIILQQAKAVTILEELISMGNGTGEKTQQAKMALINLKDSLEKLKVLEKEDRVGTWLLLKSKERLYSEFLLGSPLEEELMTEQVDAFSSIYSGIEEFYNSFLENYKAE